MPDHDQDLEDMDPKAVAALQQELTAPDDLDLRGRLQADVEFDRDRLQTLLTRLQWLEEMLAEQGDPKAQAVRKLLEGLPKEDDHGHTRPKSALFTTYKDTAQHLFKQFGGDVGSLRRDVRVQSNLEDARWMSLLTGGDDQNRRRSVLERFAPVATHRETEPLDDPVAVEEDRASESSGYRVVDSYRCTLGGPEPPGRPVLGQLRSTLEPGTHDSAGRSY